MRTIEIKAYKIHELNNTAKKTAIYENAYINVDYNWWESTYNNMKYCSIKVESFVLGRARKCEIEFDWDAHAVATSIIETYGDRMEIVKDAKDFIEKWDTLVKHYGEGNDKDGYAVKEEYYDEFDEDSEGIVHEFKNDLQHDILMMLENEYEYLTSESAIEETIEANEYEFTEEGILI